MTDITGGGFESGLEGWHDLRSHLCAWLGKRLVHMAEAGCTYPNPTCTFPSEMTREEWAALLLQHGRALVEHAELDTCGDATNASLKGAKEALHWTAEWLEDLWD